MRYLLSEITKYNMEYHMKVRGDRIKSGFYSIGNLQTIKEYSRSVNYNKYVSWRMYKMVESCDWRKVGGISKIILQDSQGETLAIEIKSCV